MTVNLSSLGGAAAQFFDNNGTPLAGGLLYTYEAGSSTPLDTYTSSAGTVSHTNPIVLDSGGRVPGGEIWLTVNTLYKFILKTAADVSIASYDNVGGINSAPFTNIANFTGDGATVNFTLPAEVTSENFINIFISGVYQFKNTYSVLAAVVTFSEAPPYNALIEVQY